MVCLYSNYLTTIGNPRVDDHSGKVMFNLRVESDMPVSKMKEKKKSQGPLLPVRLPRSLDTSENKEEKDDADADADPESGLEEVTI